MEVKLVKRHSLEVAKIKACHADIGASKTGISEVASGKIAVTEASIGKIGGCKIAVKEFGLAHIGAHQIGFTEAGIMHKNPIQIDVAKFAIRQINMVESNFFCEGRLNRFFDGRVITFIEDVLGCRGKFNMSHNVFLRYSLLARTHRVGPRRSYLHGAEDTGIRVLRRLPPEETQQIVASAVVIAEPRIESQDIS